MNLSGIVGQIKQSKTPSGMNVRLVAVDGHGGSGKTTLAKKLSGMLKAEILHTDDFASWENPYDWWEAFIDRVLEPIKQGETKLNYERSSWAPDHHPEPAKEQPVTPIMILEGVSSTRMEFRPYLTYSIWVNAPKDVCIARGVERDGEKMRKQWEKWWEDEERYIQEHHPQAYVDTKVSGV